MPPITTMEISSPSLVEQIQALERERDDAKAEAETHKKEVERLRNAQRVNRELMLKSSKEWQKRTDTIKCYLVDATSKLALQTQELEQTKRAKSNAAGAPSSLPATEQTTAEAIAAMKEFLNKNAEITGDKVFGMGKEFDHLRSLLDKIPESAPRDRAKSSKVMHKVADTNEIPLAAFGNLKVVKGGGQRPDHRDDKDKKGSVKAVAGIEPNKRIKTSG